MKKSKKNYLKIPVEHVDIKKIDAIPIVEMYSRMSFSARTLAYGALLYEKMLKDEEVTVILTLAGSLFSAGLKNAVCDLVRNNLVDIIVSTGAIIVDQDFFEALGFRHYIGSPDVDDRELNKLHIDRIYDTYIDEDELRICDMTVAEIAEKLEPKPYSSREFIKEMGRYLKEKGIKSDDSVVLACYEKNVPIFVPAFSDCSAGFGLVYHQIKHPEKHVSIDSVKDFKELTELKIAANQTGVVMLGGGVPKNFTQDIVVCADVLNKTVPMHKYAIQITVADVRDGALSSSTLKEAHSWGKVDFPNTEMIYSEVTVAFPIIAAYVYQKVKNRKPRNWNKFFEK
ncbi:MAG TPA: deoxyhypusine synthase [bacterium]|nr:deoxyhypusine synthase [bacterium]HOM26724.1 deoxyhypusine synthase [bacterium]